MISDALQDIVQVALRIDVIEFAGLDQAVNDRRALATGVRAKEQKFFLPIPTPRTERSAILLSISSVPSSV